jgi:hypothetical protein
MKTTVANDRSYEGWNQFGAPPVVMPVDISQEHHSAWPGNFPAQQRRVETTQRQPLSSASPYGFFEMERNHESLH